jgi:ankyrin repeat protein
MDTQKDAAFNASKVIEIIKINNALVSIGIGTKENIVKNNEFIAILEAIKNKDYDSMEELCRNSSDIKTRNIQLSFDLYKTLLTNNIEALRTMISEGADLTIKDSEGNTILTLSVLSNNKTFVEFLLNQSNVYTYLNSRNNTGTTALAIASELGYNEIIELLRSKGAKYCFI